MTRVDYYVCLKCMKMEKWPYEGALLWLQQHYGHPVVRIGLDDHGRIRIAKYQVDEEEG